MRNARQPAAGGGKIRPGWGDEERVLQLFATDGPVLRYAVDSRHRGDGGHQTATRPDQTRPAQSNPIQSNAYVLFLFAVNICAHTHKSAEQGQTESRSRETEGCGCVGSLGVDGSASASCGGGKRKSWLR